MAQQTAVEWLVKELKLEGYDYTVEQAKDMEKQQIIDAFDSGTIDDNIIGNEYYKETYNK